MRKLTTISRFGCIAALLSGAVSFAQTITASIRGTVTDQSGAVVVGAGVSATNVDTGVATKTVTNKSGLYNVQFLPIGNYTVTATSAGFSTEKIGPFTLEIDQIAKIDARLKVGESSAMVNVASDLAPILNTENATLGTSISANTLQNQPLNGLNVLTATLFIPGALNPAVASMGGFEGSYRNTSEAGVPSFNGNRKQGNNFVLDGVEINETIANTSGYNPSPFALQEMRVITGNADAEYGNVNGGEVIMVTKGGTNHFHGNAFEYFKNQDLTANTWGNNFNQVSKQQFSQHQFGGSIGGPILKNRLFFFGDYEGLQYKVPPSQVLSSVPTALERTGNFSEVLSVEGTQLYDTSKGTLAPVPYLGNLKLPVNNPVARYLFAHPEALPLPNHAPIDGTVSQNNYVGYHAQQNINNQADVRVDYTLSEHNTFLLKGTYGDAHDLQSVIPLPIFFTPTNDYPFRQGVINWIHTFNPSLVNEARAGYSRVVQRSSITDQTGLFGNTGNTAVGIPLPGRQLVPGFTAISIGTSDNGGFGTPQNAGKTAVDNNFDYGDNLTWVHGKHITKFGGQFVRYQENYFDPSNLGGLLGTLSYDGTYTGAAGSIGDGFADFELDKAHNAQVSGPSGPFGQRQWRDAVYTQDDWKILPNLTFNIGLRYAYDQPLYEIHDKMVSVDLKKAYFAPAGTTPASLLLFANKNGNSRGLVNPYYKQFQPRVGFALQVNPRMVFRGGYSITDSTEGTGSGLRMTQNAPFLTSFTNNAAGPGDTTGGSSAAAGAGFTSGSAVAGNGAQYDVWDPNLRPTTVQQFNLTTQIQIRSRTSAQIGYVGELGQHLIVPVLLNQYTGPVPASCPGDTVDPTCVDLVAPYYSLVGGSSQIVATTSRGIENYHALQTTLRQQEANGLEFTLNYSWSKSMTNNPGGYFGVQDTLGGLSQFWNNANDPHADYGRSGFDVPNNFSGTVIYKLPFGHGKQFGSSWGRTTDEALGGWELASNVLLSSGFPITLYQNPGGDNLNGAANYNYNGLGRVNQYFRPRIVNRSLLHWFGTDPSAIPCVTRGATVNSVGAPCAYGRPNFNQFGTAQNNTERAPGVKLVDLSLFKSFRTRGEQNLKLRVDAFNAFNLVSYAPPASRVGRAIFGKITNANSAPRQFQFSAIYQF